MLTRTSLAAALTAISLYVGNAAAQTDVLFIDATSTVTIGVDSVPGARGTAGDLAASPTDEQKYMEFKLKEVLISGVIANGTPAQPAGPHKEEIHIESFSWGANSGASKGPDLTLKSATGQPLPRGTAGVPPQAGPFSFEKPGEIKGHGDASVPGATRAAGGSGAPSIPGQSLPRHAPALAAPVGRR